MHYQIIRSSGDCKLLVRFAIDFASWTFPMVIAGKALGPTIRPQTVSNIAGTVTRNLYANAPESFVCGACRSAGCTRELRGMLSSEQASNQRHVSVLITIPLDPRSICTWKAFSQLLLCFRQLFQGCSHPSNIQVFMEAVKDKFEKLFGVLLLVNLPLRIEETTDFLNKVSTTCACVHM